MWTPQQGALPKRMRHIMINKVVPGDSFKDIPGLKDVSHGAADIMDSLMTHIVRELLDAACLKASYNINTKLIIKRNVTAVIAESNIKAKMMSKVNVTTVMDESNME